LKQNFKEGGSKWAKCQYKAALKGAQHIEMKKKNKIVSKIFIPIEHFNQDIKDNE
jgi:hypothetical protein